MAGAGAIGGAIAGALNGSFATLNGLPLDLVGSQVIRWPLYRGTRALSVQMFQGSERFNEFDSSLKYSGNTLSFSAPSQPDTPNAGKVVTIKNIYCERVETIDKNVMSILLYDARHKLSKITCDRDWNVRFEGNYLLDTSKSLTKRATISELVKRIPVELQASLKIKKMEIPRDLMTAGMTWAQALETILEKLDIDLTCDIDGKLWLVDRIDGGENIDDAFEWRIRPNIRPGVRKIKAAPETVVVNYPMRRQLTAELRQGGRTVAGLKFPDQVELEQIYHFEGAYVTGPELVFGLLGNVTEDQVETLFAKFYTDRTWKESPELSLELDKLAVRSVEIGRWKYAKEIVPIIRRDYRTLFRLKFEDGLLGDYTDLDFGNIQEDGTVKAEDAVICPWFEIYNYIHEGDSWDTAKFSENFADDGDGAPFVASWVDKKELVFRIGKSAEAGSKITVTLPGALNTDVGLKESVELKRKYSDTPLVNSLMEITSLHDVELVPNLTMDVKLVGTNRIGGLRYHKVEVPTNIFGAQGGEMEIPPSEHLFAMQRDVDYRDIINEDEIEKDAKDRAKPVIRSFQSRREGNGIATGLDLAESWKKPFGVTDMLIINYGDAGMHTIETEIVLKDSSQSTALSREQARREANYQRREMKAKKIQ